MKFILIVKFDNTTYHRFLTFFFLQIAGSVYRISEVDQKKMSVSRKTIPIKQIVKPYMYTVCLFMYTSTFQNDMKLL